MLAFENNCFCFKLQAFFAKKKKKKLNFLKKIEFLPKKSEFLSKIL